MPKINYEKLTTKEVKPIIKAVRLSEKQGEWFSNVITEHHTSVSSIIIHALEHTYPEFPKS